MPASAVAASARPAADAVALVVGRVGAQPGFSRHRDFHARDLEWHHHERRARALRHGPRRILFQGHRRSPSALPHSIGRACRAVLLVDRPASWRRQFPAVFLAGHLCRVALLHDRRQHRLRFPPARSQRRRGPIACSAIPSFPRSSSLVSAILLYYTFTDNLRHSADGCLVILAGIPVFYFFAAAAVPVSEAIAWIDGPRRPYTTFLAETLSNLSLTRKSSPIQVTTSPAKYGYQRTGAGDTFTRLRNSPKLKTPTLSTLPMLGSPFGVKGCLCPTNDFQLGLLPEKKWNWRTFAASYGLVTAFILLLCFLDLRPRHSQFRELSRDRTHPAASAQSRKRCPSRSRCPCMPNSAAGIRSLRLRSWLCRVKSAPPSSSRRKSNRPKSP